MLLQLTINFYLKYILKKITVHELWNMVLSVLTIKLTHVFFCFGANANSFNIDSFGIIKHTHTYPINYVSLVPRSSMDEVNHLIFN